MQSEEVRSGQVSVKKDGFFAQWMPWRRKWLVLDGATLSLHKSKDSRQQTAIQLQDIVNIERTDRKPCCLLLETKATRYYLSLAGDNELYDWQDDIYERSRLGGVSKPTDFKHNVHMGVDAISGGFTAMPDEWRRNMQMGPSSGNSAHQPSLPVQTRQ